MDNRRHRLLKTATMVTPMTKLVMSLCGIFNRSACYFCPVLTKLQSSRKILVKAPILKFYRYL
jgi:hypothetical protein